MKNIKYLLPILVLFLISNNSFAKKKTFLKIETNKVLCLFGFVDTASGGRSSSSSFKDFIDKNLENDKNFQALLNRYRQLYFDDRLEKEGYPESRHNSKTIKDLLWIASSNSLNINDFSNRIIGYLSNRDHVELIKILKKIEPYYDELVWNKVQNEIQRIEKQLQPFTKKIETLFLQISKFYGSYWNTEIPFKVMLYPIPLKQGSTTAIPKGNTLICSFLAKNETDYEGRLGVIIHEMCHIIFSEQPLSLQNEINSWFQNSTSSFNTLAYSFIDEGLATAIGNGWAYREIHGKIDTMDWYADTYIDGYAHSIFELVDKYLAEEKTIDKLFVENAIDLFGEKFPKSIYETAILMNEVVIFANSETKESAEKILSKIQKQFNIRSAWFSTPINDPKSLEYFNKKQKTKLFVIDSNNTFTIQYLKEKFKDLVKKLPDDSNYIYSFKDEKNRSTIIIIHPKDVDNISKGINALGKMKFVDLGKILLF